MMKKRLTRIVVFGLSALLLSAFVSPPGPAQAATVPVKPAAADSTFAPVLEAPANLTAAPISPTQIQLTWEDRSNNEIRFVIERRTGRSDYFQINTVVNNVTSYIDNSLNSGTTYYYRVGAYGIGSYVAYSNEAEANTLLKPNPAPQLFAPGNNYIISELSPLLQWSGSENTTFNLQVATDPDFTNLVLDEAALGDPYFDIPDYTFHWYSLYYWRVRMRDAAGSLTEWSAPWSFRVLPSALLFDLFCGCGG
jgi:hypothetical protein